MNYMKWEKGRQNSGYDKLKIFQISCPILADLYLLRFPKGSYVKPHKDPVEGRRHYRLNIVIKKAHIGGTFLCSTQILDWGRIQFFRSDLAKHAVSPILKGSRYVLSFGVALKC